MEASDELQAFLTKATQDGVWGRLLDRGAAWSIMRQAGVLPEDAPPLGEQIDIDRAIDRIGAESQLLVRGDMAEAQRILHTTPKAL